MTSPAVRGRGHQWPVQPGHLPRLASRPDCRGPGPHPGIVAPATHYVSAVPSVV